MNRFQSDVAEFNAAVGAVRGSTPALRDTELRARLILEEACETVVGMLGSMKAASMIYEAFDAHWQSNKEDPHGPDMVEAVDGMLDTLYVVFGAFDAFGIDAETVWSCVQTANMTKANAPKDEFGKVMKPANFVPPQDKIRAALIAMGWTP